VATFLYLYQIANLLNLMAVMLELQVQMTPSDGGGLPDDHVSLLILTTRAVYAIAYLVVGVLFLKWTYRVVANARLIDPAMPFRPGWAVIWYFIPVATLWKPFESLAAAWRVSRGPIPAGSPETPRVLRWWWGLWLASMICSNLSARLTLRTEEPSLLFVSDIIELLGNVAVIPLTFILGGIIQTLGTWQWDRRPQDEVTQVEI
jgi:hypothetical protein